MDWSIRAQVGQIMWAPSPQLSYVHQGKSTTQFIQKELVPTVKHQLKNFKMFKLLTAEWVDIALAIAKEKLASDKLRLKLEAEKPWDFRFQKLELKLVLETRWISTP